MKPTQTRRRASKLGYARGEETRGHIIAAALRLFAHDGFDGVSTRRIATEAGVNPPALQYYFDSKQGVYNACADYVAAKLRENLTDDLHRADAVLSATTPDRGALIDAYCNLVAAILDNLLSHEGSVWSSFLAKEEAGSGPGTAYPIVQAAILERLNETFVLLVSRLCGRSANALETRLRVMVINGQFQTFHTKRSGLTSLIGAQKISSQNMHLITELVINQTRVLLSALDKSEVPAAR